MGATPKPLRRQTLEKPSVSLRDGLGCLAVIAVCGAIGAGIYPYLPDTAGGSRLFPGIFAGIIGAMAGFGLYSLGSVLSGYGRGAGSLKALHARALSDDTPEDGQSIIATGVVRCDRPLTSPLGGVACAAYDYRMFVHGRTSKGGQDERPKYWGYAVQPFAIDSRSRGYPVAGTLLPGDDPVRLTGDGAAVARARQYVRATGWETVEYRMLGTLDTVFQRVSETSTTGVRRDYAVQNDDAPDVAILQLEESVLPIGATVSAFGTWSSTLGAIVATPSPVPGSFVVVAEGGPEALDGKPGVPTSTGNYIFGAFMLLVGAAGLFWFARMILPTIEH